MSRLAQRELLTEASVLSKLRHPNIVLFYGVAISYADDDLDVGRNTAATAGGPGKVEMYYFCTELCQTSLDKLPAGWGKGKGQSKDDDAYDEISHAHNRELWRMLEQVRTVSLITPPCCCMLVVGSAHADKLVQCRSPPGWGTCTPRALYIVT